MWKRNFHLVTDVDPQTAVELISKLLTKRSIKHSIANNHVFSTHIPIIILGFDRRRYSRDNLVGFNPFVYIDNIKINIQPNSEKKTKLEITVMQVRSYVPIVIIMFIILQFSTLEIDIFPNRILPIAIFATFAVLYYLFAFRLVIGYLLPSEIKRVLKSDDHENKSQ